MNMVRTLRVASLLVLLLGTSGIATSAAQEAPTCNGKAATATQAGPEGEIFGTGDDDVIVGTPGNDKIYGFGGNDTICGEGGIDSLHGNEDDDYLDGGPDFDEVRYDGAHNGVKVDLEGLGGSNAEGEGEDTIVNVEGILGSSFDDTLRGDAGDNSITGLEGDDVVFGRGGRDVLHGADGADILSPGEGDGDVVTGGEGDDTVSYRGALDSVVVNLNEGTATGGWGADSFSNLDIENVAGSDRPDILTGSTGPNFLYGYKGEDTLYGGTPDSPINDNDVLLGGGDDDLMFGGNGNDAIDGGPNTKSGDTASYEDAQGDVTAKLTTGVAEPDGWGQKDTLTDVENLTGSFGTVNFTGDNGSNRLILCNEEDTANGMGGDDVIRGGLSKDVIEGGDGNDRIYGEAGNDVLTGGANNDVLWGGASNDHLIGNGGADDEAIGGTDVDYCDAESERGCEKGPNQDRAPTARWPLTPL
ncbi:MAG: calcium-binding protein [Actinomycetota bacterium]